MDTKWNELAEWVQQGIDSADTQGVECEPNEVRREGVVEGLKIIQWKMEMLDGNKTAEEQNAALDKRAREKALATIAKLVETRKAEAEAEYEQ